jgi:dethiobiotin synthetase
MVVGTGTGVGKTWVAAALLRALRAEGRRVAARKPVQSFDPVEHAGRTDAARLGASSGEAPADVCPEARSYPLALAPPMAADALGRPALALADLLAWLRWPAGLDVGVIEAVGGVRSPLAHDADSLDLVRASAPDHVLLVADAGLGALNAVRLSAGALADASAAPSTVVLNRFDADQRVHRANRAWLARTDGLDVLGLPGDEAALCARALGSGPVLSGARRGRAPRGSRTTPSSSSG